jgi:hypothetical protein
MLRELRVEARVSWHAAWETAQSWRSGQRRWREGVYFVLKCDGEFRIVSLLPSGERANPRQHIGGIIEVLPRPDPKGGDEGLTG